jgi:4a-hydroxytetrahydrobiopterin dehydratase
LRRLPVYSRRTTMTDQCDIANRKCRPCEGGVPPLGAEEARELLAELPGWRLNGEKLEKDFTFANHHEAMAFVNAVAWVSHREDHHPELTLGYGDVRVRYWTHAIGGLSENDFICAGKLEKLLAL